jgi:hypothetical protein
MKRAWLLLLLVPLLGGCAAMKGGSMTHKVTVAQHNFLQVVNGFEDAEIAEHEQGLVPNDVHLKIQTIIQKVGLAGKDLDEALASGSGSATIKVKIDAIYTLLDSLQANGLTGIKNASAKATLEIALNQIKAVLDLALTQVAQEAAWQPQVSL